MPHRSAALAASVLAVLVAAAPAGAATAPSDPPAPAFPESGLRIVGDRHGAILRFTGAAAKVGRFWRGKEGLQVTCDTVAWRQLTDGGIAEGWAGGAGLQRPIAADRRAEEGHGLLHHPAPGLAWRGIRARRGGRDLHRGPRVGDRPAGLRRSCLSMPGPESTPPGRVPTIDEMLAENAEYTTRGRQAAAGAVSLFALAGPDATPARRQGSGFWSDGDQHAVWAVLSPTGRRLFIEREPDDVVRSNLELSRGRIGANVIHSTSSSVGELDRRRDGTRVRVGGTSCAAFSLPAASVGTSS